MKLNLWLRKPDACPVDFEVVSAISVLDEHYLSLYSAGKISTQQLQELERTQNNIVVQIEMVLKVVK